MFSVSTFVIIILSCVWMSPKTNWNETKQNSAETKLKWKDEVPLPHLHKTDLRRDRIQFGCTAATASDTNRRVCTDTIAGKFNWTLLHLRWATKGTRRDERQMSERKMWTAYKWYSSHKRERLYTRARVTTMMNARGEGERRRNRIYKSNG